MSGRAPIPSSAPTVAGAPAFGRGVRTSLMLAAFAVGVLAIAAHGPSLGAGFVYDDHRFIEKNQAIEHIDPVAFFTEASTTSAGEGVQQDIYRPLRTLLFSFEYALFGTDPGGWHLVSVLLHALNAALVLLLLAVYLRGAWLPASIGAALFAVHPVTSESVAWISSQGDLLALFLMLLSLHVLRASGPRATTLGCVLFALACCAKESALVLPGLVFLQALVLRAPGRGGALSVGAAVWRRIGLMAILVGLYFVLRISVVPTLQQIPYPGGWWGTARGMLEGMTWYAGSLLVPHGFSFDLQYLPPLSFGEPRVVLGLGILLTLLATGMHGIRARRPGLAFFALGFLMCLVPVSNVIVPLKTFIADRFLYPGLLCLAFGAALGARALGARMRAVLPFAATVIVVFLLVLCARRDQAFSDEMTLWKAVRADRPTNANAYQGIAYELARQAQISDAERAFRTYIAFNPIDGKAWLTLGNMFQRAAVSLDPSIEVAQNSNMRLRKKQAQFAQISAYREAFRIWNTFGLQVGRGSEAMRRGMFGSWLRAADELGDVLEMKRVNDLRVQLAQGLDPSDPDVFWSKARWIFRKTRFYIAARAFQKQVTKQAVPKEQLARILRSRAAVLRDVRQDPGRSDERLRVPFTRFVERETLAADKAGASVRPEDFASAATMLHGISDKQAALAMNARGLRRYPNDGLLLRQRELLLR